MRKIHVDLQADRLNIASYKKYNELLQGLVNDAVIDWFFDERDNSLDYYINRIFPEIYTKLNVERSEIKINLVLNMDSIIDSENPVAHLRKKVRTFISEINCEYIDTLFFYGDHTQRKSYFEKTTKVISEEFNCDIGNISKYEYGEVYENPNNLLGAKSITKVNILNKILSYYNLIFIRNIKVTGRKPNDYSEKDVAILEMAFQKLALQSEKLQIPLTALVVNYYMDVLKTENILVIANDYKTVTNDFEVNKVDLNDSEKAILNKTITLIEKILNDKKEAETDAEY